jgi:hypothetical protein
MRNYTLENYEEKLIHQVVHLDQGVNYCPEFRATRMMRDYPSRKLQLGWSVYKGYLKPSEHTARALFQSVLSRQGERWQNFREDPEDVTDSLILLRELLLNKGYAGSIAENIRSEVSRHDGHILSVPEDTLQQWRDAIPVNDSSRTFLLLDDATASFAADSARALGRFFERKGVSFHPDIQPVFPGWEYFAHGLVEDGIKHTGKLIEDLAKKNIERIVTVSGQAEYLLKTYLPKLPVEVPFVVESILDYCDSLNMQVPSYFYAGSFYLRYLDKGSRINALAPNSREEPVKHCAEFIPLLSADKRVNHLNWWQKPLCPEYVASGIDDSVLNSITQDSASDILKAPFEQIVVFDPYAFNILRALMGEKRVVYFFDSL